MLPDVTQIDVEREPPDPDEVDQRIILEGVTWEDYERLLELRGERSQPRMTYLEGVLELMTTSKSHERLKKKLARLVEAWATERDILFEGFGNYTIKERAVKRGLEPDECYVVGAEDRERPDLAFEIVWTHGGISKLDVYRLLDVREVWFFRRGTLTFHALRGTTYEPIPRSEVLPDLDPALIARCMRAPSQTAAVALLLEELRRT
jgi:Uma2 family endonuclease